MKYIINGRILIDNRIIKDKVIVFDEKIRAIVDENEIPANGEIVDAQGNFVSAGFVNIHIHGISGYDTMEIKGLENISREIVKTGVTSFLGSTVTSDYNTLNKLFESVSTKEDNYGAKLIGIHLEGPFISERKLGAHKGEYLKKPDINFIMKYKNLIKMITYAPEEDIDGSFLKYINENSNIIPSIGHTNGTKEEILKAVNDGCKNFTHLFNAMTGIHHRNPGAVSVGLIEDVFVELIADNIHINPYLYEMILRMKSPDKIILISDSMKAAGMEDGNYNLGELDVNVLDGRATLADGTLAGSVLELNKGLYNFVENSSISIETAIDFVTKNPANLLGLDDIGQIKEGYRGDICLFDDEINIKQVFVKGQKVY